MALYQDPAKPRPRPSLVRDLLTIPAKVDNHQIENQATCVLACLVDRSPVFARAVVELFAADALPVIEPVGARTWISLPSPAAGRVPRPVHRGRSRELPAALAGWPDGLIVGIERDANGILEADASAAFQAAGFLRLKDTAGFWLHRELWPMEDASRDPDATAAQIADALLGTGLVRGRR